MSNKHKVKSLVEQSKEEQWSILPNSPEFTELFVALVEVRPTQRSKEAQLPP